MSAELQPLIDRIQKEGVEQAEHQAEEILAKARAKAEGLVHESEETARQNLEKADRDAEAFVERSRRTLEQAARDVLLTVGQGVENIVSNLVVEELDQSLQGDILETMLVKLVEAYTNSDEAGGLDVLVSPDDKERVAAFFKARYAAKLKGGVTVRSDREIIKGFQVSFDGGRVYHDFTREAVAQALSAFLRPQLADIVKQAAADSEK